MSTRKLWARLARDREHMASTATRATTSVTMALTAADLLAWTQTILLTSTDADTPALARAEWKTIRYRLLHTGARITRTARRLYLRLAEGRPWAHTLARAVTVLRRIPVPVCASDHQPHQVRERAPRHNHPEQHRSHQLRTGQAVMTESL